MQIEKPLQLALRVMEAAGARPAIGAPEDRLISMLALHAIELARHQTRHLGHGSATNSSLPRPAPVPVGPFSSQPLRTAGRVTRQAMVERANQGLADRRRIGVELEGRDGGDATLPRFHAVGAPMGS